MILKNAIIQVLKEAKKPLNSKEIANRCIKAGLWESEGKTPDATVGANVSSDIKKNGKTSPFIRAGAGIFSLRDTQSTKYSVEKNVLHKKTTLPQITGDKKMTFVEAGELVLKRFSDGNPMHYRAITEKAMEMGLLDTTGKTPEATMGAWLGVAIKKAKARGEAAKFIRSGTGLYSLVNWKNSELKNQISKHNEEVSKKLLAKIRNLTPERFEEFVAQSLLPAMGFEKIEITQYSSDGGIDVRGTLLLNKSIHIKLAVQVKRLKQNVGSPTVQQVRGSLLTEEKGLIINTGGFSKQAVDEAVVSGKEPISLMSGKQMIALLMEYEIGVRRVENKIFELDELPIFNSEDLDEK